MIDFAQKPEYLRWASERIGDAFDPQTSAWLSQIGPNGDIEAVTIFTGWSDFNVFVSTAVEKPGTRQYIREVFRYAFRTLGVFRVTFMSKHTNHKAIAMHKRLGAVYEATLLHYYGMEHAVCSRILEPECKWLGVHHVKPVQDTQSA